MNTSIPTNDPDNNEVKTLFIFLSAGFRPFFLFAGIYGAVPLLAWLWVFLGDGSTPGNFAPSYWHGHEMIFGFVIAAAAGFLLTAVPNWTGSDPFSGWPLAILVLIWVSGRMAMWFGASLGPHFVAGVDLLMIPALAIYIGRRLVAHKVRRNYIVLGVLGLLFMSNLMMHLEATGTYGDSARFGLDLGMYGVVILVTLISGRVIPGFTANALRRQGVEVETGTPESVTKAVMLCVILAVLSDLFAGESRLVAGIFAAFASLALLIRMGRWKTRLVLGDPIVWVLHAGHLWLVMGFALLAAANLSDAVERGAAVHALTAGAMGTMVLAMMSRVALGHSGREILASPATVAAYWMVIMGSFFRVSAPLVQVQLPGDSFSILIGAAGLLWAGGYMIFTVAFWPILIKPRL